MSLSIKPQPFQPRNHDQFEVTAEGLGRYVIDVSVPMGYEMSGTQYPVVVVVDGNLLFDMVQTTLHGRFAQAGSILPPAIVVGVGYPADEGFASFFARRNFDFHDDWAMTDPLGKVLVDVFDGLKKAEGKPEMVIRAGGYPRFMAFLRDELLPALAEAYRIDLGARHTLVGDSSGGYFAMRAMFDPQSPFRRIVAISPGFGSAENGIVRAEAAYAATEKDLDVDLFLCCGRVEIDENPIRGMCRFGSGVTWLAEQFAIRQWPNARIDWEVMNHEDHTSIAPRAIAAGLRSVHRLRPGVHAAELAQVMAAARAAMTEKATPSR